MFLFLQKKEKVRVLIMENSDIISLKNMNVEIFHGDLNDISALEKAVKNIDTVYHLAGFIGGDEFPYSKFRETNVGGTKNLIKACIKNKVRKFVFTSTVAVIDAIKEADENAKCNPNTKYGKSKLEAENFLIDHSDEINTTILRFSPVYGKGEPEKRRFTRIIKKIADGKFIIFGKGDNLMPILHIDDAVNAIVLAGKHRETGQIFIISGESVTMQELSGMITGYKKIKKTSHLPYFIGFMAGISLGIIETVTRIKMPLNLGKFRRLFESRSFDTEKAKKVLEWKPKVKFRDVIDEII